MGVEPGTAAAAEMFWALAEHFAESQQSDSQPAGFERRTDRGVDAQIESKPEM